MSGMLSNGQEQEKCQSFTNLMNDFATFQANVKGNIDKNPGTGPGYSPKHDKKRGGRLTNAMTNPHGTARRDEQKKLLPTSMATSSGAGRL